QRTSFRYDALASAQVAEAGVKFAGERRHVLLIGDDGFQVTDKTDSLVLSRAFRLSLSNGQDITVLVENFDGLVDTTVEDKHQLVDVALDTSGVAAALHILEAIAAEGGEWIDRERERRARRWRDWLRGPNGRRAVTDGTKLLSIAPAKAEHPAEC